MLEPAQHLRWGCLLLIVVVAVASGGYMVLLHWPPGDAIYMTVITITTIGFKEVRPLDAVGRVWTLLVVVFGLVAIGYLGSSVISAMTEGRIRQVLGRYKLDQKLQELRNHVVVCAYGHMASLVCQGLTERRVPFVAIDSDAERVREAQEAGHLCMHGDATDDQVLLRAGVQRAHALVTVLPSDADNVFITLSARNLNKKLAIVALAQQAATPQKLRVAGATHVVSPHVVGAMRIANLVTRPGVVAVVDVVTGSVSEDLVLEDLSVPSGSPLVGKSLLESDIRKRTGLIVVAIRRTDGTRVFNPDASTMLQQGDTVVVLGPVSKMDAFRREYGVTAAPGPGDADTGRS